MAGNVLLISPELLVEDKLLTTKGLQKKKNILSKTDYASAEKYKTPLLQEAYSKWKTMNAAGEQEFI